MLKGFAKYCSCLLQGYGNMEAFTDTWHWAASESGTEEIDNIQQCSTTQDS
jgi:hypothetical protein